MRRGKVTLPPVRPVDETVTFHWLTFAGDPEIWRWKDGRWISVYVQTDFTPEQLADQGWRYDSPCIPASARHARQPEGAGVAV